MMRLLRRPNLRAIRSSRAVTSISGVEKHNRYLQPDFTTPEKLQSFQLKSSNELLRTLIILRLSAIDAFVYHSEKILTTARAFLGQRIFDALMKWTFYGQFAAGESVETLTYSVKKLRESGVRSMLCIPIETTATNEDDLKLGSSMWEKNAGIVSECIDMTDKLEKGGFSQLKLTALCEPELLLNMNEKLIPYEYNHAEPHEWSIRRIGELLKSERYEDINIETFNDTTNEQLRAAFQRFDKLAMSCAEKGITFTIDAEQTYIQAALAFFVLTLQQKYNRTYPMVYNTYQCYRKDTLTRIKADYEYAKANGFKIAGKLVRGAYMAEERQLAAETGSEDPINEGYDKTTEMYHSVVDFVLPLVKAGESGFMVATHNENTILYVLKRMKELSIEKENRGISFAQLYGMCDHITEALGKINVGVYKSVPYGTVDSTLLYLTRRAQENRSVLERGKIETGIVIEELFRRSKEYFKKGSKDIETFS